MRISDLERKDIIISGRAAIRSAVEAGENLKYQFYDLMNDRTSINDALSLQEQCEILRISKSAVKNLWTRVRKWFANETLTPYSVKQDLEHKGKQMQVWMTYNIANKKEYQRYVIARKERSITGMRELDKANLVRTGLTSKQRLQAETKMKRRRQKITGGYIQ